MRTRDSTGHRNGAGLGRGGEAGLRVLGRMEKGETRGECPSRVLRGASLSSAEMVALALTVNQ